MALVAQIDEDLVAAMKAKEELRLSVLRMMKTALKLKQTETGKALDDAQAFAVCRILVNQRRDSAEQFRKGGREEMAAKEEAEIKIVEGYLPAGASDEDIDDAVAAALAETGITAVKEMGKVMKAAMAKLAGKNADGKRVSERVRMKLGE
ncbi:MAG TPA: GatB/YqeY domain-containing protein [Terriglobia bacterium]|nr:GatB/YqeY domain-containing protein [Terriglobia bacterium]